MVHFYLILIHLFLILKSSLLASSSTFFHFPHILIHLFLILKSSLLAFSSIFFNFHHILKHLFLMLTSSLFSFFSIFFHLFTKHLKLPRLLFHLRGHMLPIFCHFLTNPFFPLPCIFLPFFNHNLELFISFL